MQGVRVWSADQVYFQSFCFCQRQPMLKCTHMEVVCYIFAGALFLACCFCIILLRPIERAYFQFP